MKTMLSLFLVFTSIGLAALSTSPQSSKVTTIHNNFSNKISSAQRQRIFTKNIVANYSIKPGETLNVYNPNGSIVFIGWNYDYIKVTAVKKAYTNYSELDNIHMTLNTIKGLSIETVHSPDCCAKLDYVINVPKDIAIREVYSSKGVSYKNLSRAITKNVQRLSYR